VNHFTPRLTRRPSAPAVSAAALTALIGIQLVVAVVTFGLALMGRL
jgi:ABC-type lipoprotein release transport system permease subunit